MEAIQGLPTRDAYGKAIVALGEKNRNVYVVDCDIGKSCKTGEFMQTFSPAVCQCRYRRAERLRSRSGIGDMWKNPICHHLCGLRQYADARTDTARGMLPQSECEDSLFAWRFHPCQRWGEPPGNRGTSES